LFNEHDILVWAWRLPFLLSVVLIFIAIYIRRTVAETSFFTIINEQKQILATPLIFLIKHYPFLLICGITITSISAFGITTLYVFMPNILKMNSLLISSQTLFAIIAIGTLILMIFMPLWGIIADKFGRKVTLVTSIILLLLCFTYITFVLKTAAAFYWFMILSSIAFAGVNAIYCPILSELFPTNIRFSGVALCYTCAYSICGGILPLIYLAFPQNTRTFHLPLIILFILFVMFSCCWKIIPEYKNHELKC
jgi:MFS family permease